MVSPEALDWFDENLTGRPRGGTASVPLPEDVRVEQAAPAGHAARWCIPAAADIETVVAVDAPWPAAVLLLADPHAGAGADPIAWAAQLASRCGIRVLVPEAVPSPTVPSPTPSSSTLAIDCYRWLLTDGGFFGQHMAVVAEGAGAAAALALLDDLVDSDRSPDGPALVVLLSPWVDPAVADPLDRDRGPDPDSADETDLRLGGDLVHTVATLRRAAPAALPARSTDPRVLAAGTAQVHVGGSEILVGDALAVTRVFAAQDVPVTLRVWPYLQYGFHRPTGRFSEADIVTDEIAATVRAALRE